MNISNTISYDSQYPKSDSVDMGIKQNTKPSESVITESSDFKESMNNADQKEKKQQLDDITDIINKSNKDFKAFDRRLEISIHAKTREVMIKVIDTTTDEVIREIPPEKVLDNVVYRREMCGNLMDKKI